MLAGCVGEFCSELTGCWHRRETTGGAAAPPERHDHDHDKATASLDSKRYDLMMLSGMSRSPSSTRPPSRVRGGPRGVLTLDHDKATARPMVISISGID